MGCSKNNPFRFSTKYYDTETGLYYYAYRYYSPYLGRWITRDPIGEEGGLNLYSYTINNPINFVDADGQKTTVIFNKKTNTVTVLTNIIIWGSEVNQKSQKHLEKLIKNKWNNKKWNKKFTLKCNGAAVNVVFDVDISVSKEEPINNPNNADVIKIEQEGRSFIDPATNPKTGTWYKNFPGEKNNRQWNWGPAHEYGHLINLIDRYDAMTVKPHKGWEGNIMAVFGGKVEIKNIEEFLKKYCCTISDE